MTKAELINLLEPYPDDYLIYTGEYTDLDSGLSIDYKEILKVDTTEGISIIFLSA